MEDYTQSFDVCIVCALYEEAKAVISEFSGRCGTTFTKAYYGQDRFAYQFTSITNKTNEVLSIFVTWLPDMGPTMMAQELKVMTQRFHPRFVVMTGICAGDQSRVQLGDLIVASAAYHYEAGKVTRGSDGQEQRLLAPHMVYPTDQVLQYAKGFEDWQKPIAAIKQDLLRRPLQEVDLPKQHIGPMASGMAVRADNPFPALQAHYHRQTVALDMEAASFYQALGNHSRALVVKGVCDFADQTKNDAYHDYAARASAVYTLFFIQEYVTEQTMPRQSPSDQAESSSQEHYDVSGVIQNVRASGASEISDIEQNTSNRVNRVSQEVTADSQSRITGIKQNTQLP